MVLILEFLKFIIFSDKVFLIYNFLVFLSILINEGIK